VWPFFLGNRWLELALAEPGETPEDISIAAMLLCQTADVLLERLLADILRKQQAKPEHLDVILRAHIGQAQRVALFARLAGKPMADAGAELGFEDTFNEWQQVAGIHRRFVAGDFARAFTEKAPERKALENFRRDVLEFFRQLHNRYAT
jgi:hypothetical protein